MAWAADPRIQCGKLSDRKSTRLNSSHTVIYTLSLHDALPISGLEPFLDAAGIVFRIESLDPHGLGRGSKDSMRKTIRSEEHTSELQSHSDLHSFPTRRSSDLRPRTIPGCRRDSFPH